MKIFQGMSTSISGLTAEKLRMDVIANNVANVNTTRTPDGGPYKRKMTVFREILETEVSHSGDVKTSGKGVRVTAIKADEETPGRVEYDPSHPDADENGNVTYPNIDLTAEMINMITAQRSYQANAAAYQTTKQMLEKSLEIGRG